MIVPTLQRGNAALDAPASRIERYTWAESRYVILEPDKPHFLTCTVVEWLPVFTCLDSVWILLDCRRHWIGGFDQGRTLERPDCIPTLERGNDLRQFFGMGKNQ